MTGIEIVATAVEIPTSASTVASAVDAGSLSAQAAGEIGVVRLPVAVDTSAPQLAVRAAESALTAGDVDGADLDVVAHAWTYYQGHDFWSPAHYIAHQVGATDAIPFGIQQMCNGGAMAVQLAVQMLHSTDCRTALITTGDVFADDGFDRWGADFGLVYGDGGTATLLRATDDPDCTALLAMETVALPEVEEMHRGDDPFTTTPRAVSQRVDVRRTKRAYLNRHGADHFDQLIRSTTQRIVEKLLTSIDVGADDSRLRWVAMPRVGMKAVAKTYAPGVRAVTDAPHFHVVRDTGHLGAGDLVANLHGILSGPSTSPGDIVIALSAGAGFTVTGMAVRIGRRR